MVKKNYVLISGASSGIGQHIAINLSNKNNLILAGRNDEALSNVLNLCGNKENHLKWIFDLKNVEDIEDSLIVFVREHNISISAFIHCAGLLKIIPLKNFKADHLQDTMNVNFTSAALIIKTLISKKANEKSLSNVIFISSVASIRGVKAFNIYAASKGALDSLMRSLAVELAPEVRLNSILPGSIKTKMTENIFNNEELVQNMSKDYPLGFGEPNDIYEMVNFLLSDKSKWITGQQFVLDGGRTINITA